jgi:hypothetical protein
MPLAFMQDEQYSLIGCFCKIISDLTLGIYKITSVKNFWVEPILDDLVL